MSTGMMDSPLGELKCQHRWQTGPDLTIPRTPGVDPDQAQDGDTLGIETGWCQRCGAARLRYYSLESDYAISGWSRAESWEELVLGRPLKEHELESARKHLVLN